MTIGSVGGRFADSSVAVTTYGAFEQPEIGEVALVDVGDGSKLTAGMSVYLVRTGMAGAYYYEVEDSEGGEANQAQLRCPANPPPGSPAPGTTIAAGDLFIVGPRGASATALISVSVGSTSGASSGAEFSAYGHPTNESDISFSKIDIWAVSALTAAVPSGDPLTATNYKALVITVFGADAGLRQTITIDFTTANLPAGHYHTGSIGAHGVVTIALDTAVTLQAGYSVDMQIVTQNGSQATPSFRVLMRP